MKKFKPRKTYKSRVLQDYFYVDKDGDVDFKMIYFLDDNVDKDDESVKLVGRVMFLHKEKLKVDASL